MEEYEHGEKGRRRGGGRRVGGGRGGELRFCMRYLDGETSESRATKSRTLPNGIMSFSVNDLIDTDCTYDDDEDNDNGYYDDDIHRNKIDCDFTMENNSCKWCKNC